MLEFFQGFLPSFALVIVIFFYERQRRSIVKDHLSSLNILHAKIEIKNREILDLTQKLESFHKNPSQDCQQLLAAIASGVAVLKIEVVDHSDMFIWKPGKK